jgi:hypothetical protein
MVKVWGRWCGPSWTSGRPIPAKDYDWVNDPSPKVQDSLDMACRIHDRTYGTNGDRSQADKLLRNTALKIAARNPLSAEGIAAVGVAAAMTAKEVWD